MAVNRTLPDGYKERLESLYSNQNTQQKLKSGFLLHKWTFFYCGNEVLENRLCSCNKMGKKKEQVDHPGHYNKHPSGIECIDVVEHMGFNLGNAVKYVWRADLKEAAIQDMQKAIWYIKREITKREDSLKINGDA